jgi:predicted site-specific integrase-resolvase
MVAQNHVYVRPAELNKRYSIGSSTLQRWATTGQITFVVTPGGKKRYLLSDIETLLVPTIGGQS